uniref:Cyclic nucleotide-binding domain-containing protein n=1 Tax=Spumella elongata TaxID=89044 RepID=A0A7S3M3M3_9STRA
MSYEGIEEYFSHDWQQLYFIVAILSALDLFFFRCTYLTNPLRPVVGVLRARKGRRFFEVLKKMMPGMTHSLVPLLFFIVIVMVLSALMFDGTIQDLANPMFTSYNWFFLIFTNDNFDRILPDEVMMNMSYLLFFFPCIYVGQQFLLSLIIGDTYETYKAFVKKQLKKERLKEMQGLTKAFSSLDDQKHGVISALQWKECLNKYDPSIPDEAVALYFELLSGGNSVIGVLQFLSMRSVLNFNLSLKSNHKALFSSLYLPVVARAKAFYKSIQLPIKPFLVTSAKTMLDKAEEWNLFTKLNYLDLIALCFALSDLKVGPFLMPYNIGNYMLIRWIPSVSVDFLLTCCYLLEIFLRVCMHDGKLYMVQEKYSFIARAFVMGTFLSFVIFFADVFYDVAPDYVITVPFLPFWSGIMVRKLLLLCRALRCFRIANLNKDLRNFSMALFDVLPALTETFTFSFIITYIFGALGNLLFGTYMEEWRTPLRSVVKAQQLTFMVDFLSSTEKAMEQVHPFASLFFVFYLILSLAVSNIALSIIIELQNNMLAGKTSKDRDGEKVKLELMFNKIKDQARMRSIFSRNKGHMNFSNIVMSQFQSSDTRHFIADMDGEKELKLEDIKSCQKYSSIDLVSHYNREHRDHTDQHWEVEFLTAAKESGVKEQRTFKPKEVMCTPGDSAEFLYLIISGSVAVCEPPNLGSAYISAAQFVGQESLYPNGRYTWLCVAESETIALVLSRSDVTDKLDTDLCGAILRMSLKSFAKTEAALLDARKRASRALSTFNGNNFWDDGDDESMASPSSKSIMLESARDSRAQSFDLDECSSGKLQTGSNSTKEMTSPTKTASPMRTTMGWVRDHSLEKADLGTRSMSPKLIECDVAPAASESYSYEEHDI